MADTTAKSSKRVRGRPFKPGQSGNPKGRPKGSTSIADILRRIGKEPGTLDGMDKAEVVWRKVYQFAIEGKAWAVEFIANRTEGKAVERIALEAKQTPWEIMNDVIKQGEKGDSNEEATDSNMDTGSTGGTAPADTSGDD